MLKYTSRPLSLGKIKSLIYLPVIHTIIHTDIFITLHKTVEAALNVFALSDKTRLGIPLCDVNRMKQVRKLDVVNLFIHSKAYFIRRT